MEVYGLGFDQILGYFEGYALWGGIRWAKRIKFKRQGALIFDGKVQILDIALSENGFQGAHGFLYVESPKQPNGMGFSAFELLLKLLLKRM